MNDNQTTSGLMNWLANYPWYPSLITGGLIATIGAAMSGAAAIGLWTAPPLQLLTAGLTTVMGIWVAWAGYHNDSW